MKIELTIKTDYLPRWGAYEGLRELIQNGKDAETEFAAPLEVRYRKDSMTLVIENDGCTLAHEALLFGHTTKTGRGDMIGKFGEGLKLGVLALVRAGKSVKIRSGSEVWTPKLERSEKFNADVLVFYIDKGREPKDRVAVEVSGIIPEDWENFHDHFLFLKKLPASTAIKTGAGTLLLDPKYKGILYVKGILVQKTDREFGYDLSDAEVDRDRKMCDAYDVNYRAAAIWREALAMRPDLFKRFETMLEESAADVGGINEWNASLLPVPILDMAAESFKKRHGDRALPVQTLADSQDVEHLGKTGVVCPKPLRCVLETRFGTIAENKKKLANETNRLYGWGELTAEEQRNVELAVARVGAVAPVTIADVDVADFRDPALRGLFKDGRIYLAKKSLADRSLTLRILVHETAHKMGGGDGEKEHVANIETIWSAIVARMES